MSANTTNKPLIAYLKTIGEIEKAIYTCDEEIEQLNRQKNAIRYPEEPVFPHVKMEKPRYWNSFEGLSEGKVFLAFIVFLVIGAMLNATIMSKSATGNTCLVAAILTLILILFCKYIPYSEEESAYEQAQNDAKALFSARTKAHREGVAKVEQSKRSICQTVAQIENKRNQLQAKLNILYKAKILDPFFQNMFAVEHLHLYLNTGMCPTLTSAYRLYMQAYNARQIITSINELKAEVLALRCDMNRNYRLMAQQLFDIQRQLDETNSNMSCYINSINNTLYDIGTATVAQLEEQNRCLSSNLGNLNRTLSIMAHNQYVDGALSHADDFFRHYRLP